MIINLEGVLNRGGQWVECIILTPSAELESDRRAGRGGPLASGCDWKNRCRPRTIIKVPHYVTGDEDGKRNIRV